MGTPPRLPVQRSRDSRRRLKPRRCGCHRPGIISSATRVTCLPERSRRHRGQRTAGSFPSSASPLSTCVARRRQRWCIPYSTRTWGSLDFLRQRLCDSEISPAWENRAPSGSCKLRSQRHWSNVFPQGASASFNEQIFHTVNIVTLRRTKGFISNI